LADDEVVEYADIYEREGVFEAASDEFVGLRGL
jgi:hypothetical protein